MAQIKLVNNTGVDIRLVEKSILDAVDVGFLPEDLSEIFTLTILIIDGNARGILEMA